MTLELIAFICFCCLVMGGFTGFAVAQWMYRIEPQAVDAAIDYSTHGQEPEELYYDGQFIKRENGRLVFIDANESNWLDITELGSPKYRFMYRDSGKILEMDREG